MSTELEKTLARELTEVADGVLVPPMPALPSDEVRQPLVTRIWQPLLVAAAAVLVVGGLAVVVGRPGDAPPPTDRPTQGGTTPSVPQDGTISTAAPTVPYVVDQRLYVDGTPVPGTWWSVESRGQTWLAQQADGTWWSGGPGRDTDQIAAELDQPPVMSPDGLYVAFVDLSSGDARLTGFDTLSAGEGLGSAPVDLPRTEGGVPIRVRAVTDDGDVVVQGRRTSLLWRAGTADQQTVVDLSETAPEQQFLGATAAGLVVVDGLDADPQSTPAYLADVSGDGDLTRTGTLPTYDDLEISPGGTSLVLSPPGTLGGEVTAVATLDARAVAGGDETTLAAPRGWGFATGTWTWEDDRTVIAVLLPQGGAGRESRLARCDVGLGECRALAAPAVPTGAEAATDAPSETAPETAPEDYTVGSALDAMVEATVAGDRTLLLDQAAIGDVEWDQLVGWAAGEGGSGGSCRDNGGGSQDCEIDLDADPGTTYYVILEPAGNAYGWRITYAGIAHD